MNENDVKQNGAAPHEETNRVAVAAGSIIASALDAADVLLEFMSSRRTAERVTDEPPVPASNGKSPDYRMGAPDGAQVEDTDAEGDDVAVLSVKAKAPEHPTGAPSFELADDDNAVEVRVSAHAPYAEQARPRGEALRELAEALLDTLVEHAGSYAERSAVVNKVIRAQINQLLRELEHDPLFTALLRAQVGEYIDELAAEPRKLQPLFRSQIDTYFVQLTERPEVVEPVLRQQANRYLDQLLRDSAQANALAEKIADSYLARLQENPDEVEPLVRALAARYIAALQANPAELAPLIERLGDEYIDYLRQHPEVVQDLVKGQSRNVMDEVVNEARERAATSDAVFELFARKLIGRPPREDLPPPPPEVQQYAQRRPSEPTTRAKKSRGKP